MLERCEEPHSNPHYIMTDYKLLCYNNYRSDNITLYLPKKQQD